MIWYTTSDGKHICVCDICRKDILEGENALAISPGRTNAGFFSRDFARQEKVLCPDCAEALTGMINLLGNPRLRSPSALRLLEAV